MELDFKYKQYDFLNKANFDTKDENEKVAKNRPHQDLIDFLESHLAAFNYQEIKKITKIQDDTDIVLSDGSTVHVGVCDDLIIRFALKYPDGTGFIGYYCSTTDGQKLEPYL